MDLKHLLTNCGLGSEDGEERMIASTVTSMSSHSSGGEARSPVSGIGFLLNEKEEATLLMDKDVDAECSPSISLLSPGSPSDSMPGEKIVEVSRKDQLRYSCDVCGRFFRVRRDLVHHVRCVHERSRPFACTQCPAKFSIRPNLSRHIRTVHEKQKPFKCNECQRFFGLKENLEKHIRLVHEKQRPFTCEYCGFSFGIMSTLKRHIQRNHQDTSNVSRQQHQHQHLQSPHRGSISCHIVH